MMKTKAPRILLVEDSPSQAQLLHKCIHTMGLSTMGPVDTATEALGLCQTELPAIAILDVQLAGSADGAELAIQLSKLGDITIIFATAIEDADTLLRLQALNPLAILPKPYNTTSLRRVVELGLYGRMHTPVEWRNGEEITEVILPTQLPWLFVRERGLLMRVNTEDIICVQMEKKYCIITLVSGRHHLVRIPLGQMLHLLGTEQFVQVHRSWVVQLKRIEVVDLAAGTIRLSDIQAPLGRAYREELIHLLHLLD